MRSTVVAMGAAVLFALGCNKTDPPAPQIVIPEVPVGGLSPHVPLPGAVEVIPIVPQTDMTVSELAEAYGKRTRQLLDAAGKGQLSLLLELVQGGANVNDKDDSGRTALHEAAAKGHASIVVALLTMGASMSERDAQGRLPVMEAAANGNVEVLELLLSPVTVSQLAGDFANQVGDSLQLDIEGLEGRLRASDSGLLEVADLQGRTALMHAAAAGHSDCIRVIYTSLNSAFHHATRVDEQGQTALMLAAEGGHTEAMDELLHNYWVLDSYTVAELRRKDGDGKTALDLAEASGNVQAAKLLWDELALAAGSEGDVETVREVHEKFPDDFPATGVMRKAATTGALGVVRYLMEQWKDKPVEAKTRLVGAIPARDQAVSTALHQAGYAGKIDVVKALIDPEWWQDTEALVAFIRFKSLYGSSLVDEVISACRELQPEVSQVIEARLQELETPE